MAKRNYLYLAIGILLLGLLIIAGIHWGELWSLLSAALTSCLRLGILFVGLMLIFLF